MYFVSRSAEFTPQANKIMLLSGVPLAILAAVSTQIVNRPAAETRGRVHRVRRGRRRTHPGSAHAVMNFPFMCALHLSWIFLVLVPTDGSSSGR